MEYEISLSCSQGPATYPYSEPDETRSFVTFRNKLFFMERSC